MLVPSIICILPLEKETIFPGLTFTMPRVVLKGISSRMISPIYFSPPLMLIVNVVSLDVSACCCTAVTSGLDISGVTGVGSCILGCTDCWVVGVCSFGGQDTGGATGVTD